MKCKVPQPLTGILQRWTVASAAQLVRAHPLYLSLDFHHTANKHMSFWEPAITSTSLSTLTGSTPSVHDHDQTNAKSRNSKDPPGFFGGGIRLAKSPLRAPARKHYYCIEKSCPVEIKLLQPLCDKAVKAAATCICTFCLLTHKRIT